MWENRLSVNRIQIKTSNDNFIWCFTCCGGGGLGAVPEHNFFDGLLVRRFTSFGLPAPVVPCPPLLPDEVPGLPEEGPGFWFVFCGCVLVFFLSGPASQTPAVVAISPILLVQSSTTDRSSGVANGARGSNFSLISNKSNKSDFGRVTSSIVSAVLRSNGRCFFAKFKLSQLKPSAGMVGFPKLFYILTVK